jgi:hypothetical protein
MENTNNSNTILIKADSFIHNSSTIIIISTTSSNIWNNILQYVRSTKN